jgi:hypothetical protein
MTKAPMVAFLWLAGALLTAHSAPAVQCNPDPYDELRCTRGLDPQTCKCIGEELLPPKPPSPCQSPQSDADHWACVGSRLRYLDILCADSRISVRDRRVSRQWQDIWRYANDHGWSRQIQLPPNCEPGRQPG